MRRYKQKAELPRIRPLCEVEREHIEATLAKCTGVPLSRVAVELGISLSTLLRRLDEWGWR